MAVVDLIDADRAPLLMRGYYERGNPGPLVGAFANVPELARVVLPFIDVSLGGSWLSERTKEMAILRTSARMHCRYCTDTHSVAALDSGLDLDEVRVLRCELPDDAAFADPADAALLRWVDAVATGHGPVPADVIGGVKAVLPDHAIVDLTTTVGTTLMLNRVASALGLPPSRGTLRRLEKAGLPSRTDWALDTGEPVP
jgi:AhpD family alkylhydroperoxidase